MMRKLPVKVMNPTPEKGMTFALNLLTFRSRTVKEVEKRLKEKGYPQEIIDEIIEKLIKLKYLDDKSYADDFIKSRTKYGTRKLKIELRQKGIENETVQDCLDECLDSETESSRAICEAQKALKTMRPPYDRAVLLRLRGRLARRGFSSEIINQAIREINLPDLDAEGLD